MVGATRSHSHKAMVRVQNSKRNDRAVDRTHEVHDNAGTMGDMTASAHQSERPDEHGNVSELSEDLQPLHIGDPNCEQSISLPSSVVMTSNSLTTAKPQSY